MHEFLLVAGIHLLAVMSPGLNLALVVRNSLTFSRTSSIWVAVGLALGDLVHVSYSLVGLALLLEQSAVVFTALKWLGASYLIYVGIRALIASSRPVDSTSATPGHRPKQSRLAVWKAIRLGFLTDVLNPKASLFFIALFTQVIQPTTKLELKLLYGSEMVLATFTWFTCVALLFTHGRLQRAFARHQHRLDRAFGVILIFFGLNIAFLPHIW